ncbi:MAG: hypothetical protein ABJK28_12715 [Algibacter sp.]
MENRTEFNLENNIKKWKSSLTKKNNLTKSNVIELESHLFDLIDDLESNGLNKEESFIIARKRIGKIDDICLEFDKVNTDFSSINKVIPYLKGALIYIAFIMLSKLFLVITLALSQILNLNNSTFIIISTILLTSVSISFFSTLYFNIKRGKSFLSKLSNVNAIVTLIIILFISHVITYRFSAQITLPGIDVTQLQYISTLENHFIDIVTFENIFAVYKIFCGFILLTTSLIFFWNNKKYNKLKLIK